MPIAPVPSHKHLFEFLFRSDGSAWHIPALLSEHLKEHEQVKGVLICHPEDNVFGIFTPSGGWKIISRQEWNETFLTPAPVVVYKGGWAVIDRLTKKTGRPSMTRLTEHDIIFALRAAGAKIPDLIERVRSR